MPSYKTPTPQQIEVVAQRLRSPELAAYFLSRLQSPAWIAPFFKHGVFASPPPAVAAEDGALHYPIWSASQYLARMAAQSPSEVAAILAPIETNNPSVLKDILDAAAKMPADVAATLVPTVCKAIGANALWLHFPNATDLCVRLASEHQETAAMKLANTLFVLNSESGTNVVGHHDRYWYVEGLKKVVPVLAKVRPRQFLPVLCDWTCAAINIEGHSTGEIDLDGSWHWRPAIEEHQQNETFSLAGEMVGFARQAFEQAITDGQITFDDGLAVIDKYHYLVFKRLRILELSQIPSQSSGEVQVVF
jgi:hypothetical protein